MSDRLISRTERFSRIERLLFGSAEGMRVVEIAHTLGVDRRTIYRDMETLSRSGVPIWQEAGRFGVARDEYLASVRLNIYEALMLFLAAHMFASQIGAYGAILAASLTRLAVAFPEPAATLVESSANAVRACAAEEDDSGALKVIIKAWADLRQVRLWYQGRRYDVSVHSLTPTGIGGVYIIGSDAATGKEYAFRLEWVERAQPLNERYARPSGFDPEDPLSQLRQAARDNALIEVVLEFTPAVASFIKARLWHPSQTIEELDSGACRLTLYISDLQEVRTWLLSWGAEVQVLSPPALREAIADEARRLATLYG